MGKRRARNLTLILWLSLPTILFSHLASWGRMPPEIAVHFTLSGRPVTLMGRVTFLFFSLMTLVVVLVACTWQLRRPDEMNRARTVLRCYFAVISMVLIYFCILIYNICCRA